MWTQTLQATSDIRRSLANPRLWVNLAWRDLIHKYERSYLGVFWVTLQMAAWVSAIVFVLGGIVAPIEEYAVYVVLGIFLYNFVTHIVTDSSEVFITNRIVIHSHPSPFLAFILKHLVSGLIQMALQTIVVLAVFVIFKHALSSVALLAIPGLLIGIGMALFLSLTLALLGLRYGDFRFGMQAIMRLGLFVTPILWVPAQDGGPKSWVANLNPITHFIALVRDPMLGSVPPLHSYFIAIATTAFLAIVGWFLFSRLRATIPMWL